MIRPPRFAFAAVATLLVALPLRAQEVSQAIAGGGISVAGWTGKIDANEEKAGLTLKSAKFAAEGKGFRVTTGPATSYWNPANKASGNYTVKATFTEPEYMNRNDHPHPYGIMIAGNNLDGAHSLLYCAAYGTGTFIVRGFGPAAFQLGGRRPIAHDSIHKAAGKGQPVTQDIAVSVKDGKVSCIINRVTVATYDKADAVGEGKLTSLDGTYGLRFGHNTEVVVSGFSMTKP